MKRLLPLLWLCAAISITLSLAWPVLASDVSTAKYKGTIIITNNNTSDLYNAIVPVTINSTFLTNGYYASTNFLNTDIRNQKGTDVAYMPALGANTTWMVYAPPIIATYGLKTSSATPFTLYTGNTTSMGGKLAYFPGTGGMVTTNSTTMNLASGNFTITQVGLFSYQSGDYFVSKQNALIMYYDAASNITATMIGATNTTVSYPKPSNTDNENIITLTGNTTNLGLYYNDVLKASVPITAPMNSNANSWNFFTGSGMRYILLHNVYAPTNTLVQNITYNGAYQAALGGLSPAIFLDASGKNHDATPTFATTGTAGVSAVLADFNIINQSIATNWSLSSYQMSVGTIPTEPTEMYEQGAGTFPGHDIPDQMSDAGGVPRNFFWYMLANLVVVLPGIFIHDKTRSLMTQAIVMVLICAFFGLAHIIPFWLTFIFAIQASAIVLAGKTYGY